MSPCFDAHVHVWEHPWENFIVGTAREGRFAQRDLIQALMDRHGVQGACLLAACNEQNPHNNEFVAELCRSQPDRFVMFSEVRLTDPSRDALLERTMHDWPAVGFRYMIPRDETPAQWSGPADASFWERVNTQRLFVAFNLNPQQALALPPLIERYAQITWLIDHMGRPQYNMNDSDYEAVLKLSTYPNVYIKVSGFYAFTEHQPDYPYRDLAPFLKRLLATFGSRRLLWGSDAPPVLDFSSYEQTFACLRHLLAETPAEDLAWIMGRTAKSLFKK